MAKLRLNIQMEENMKNWCQLKSEEFGISMSGFINVVLAQYKQQQESLVAIGKMEDLVKVLEDLKGKGLENNSDGE